MAQQTGRLLMIKRETATPGTYEYCAGIRARSFEINNNMVDSTVADIADLAGIVQEAVVYGIQSMNFSGAGLFDNVTVGKAVATDAINQVAKNYQVIVPGLGTFTAEFKLESFKLSGDTEGEMEFDTTFRKSGAVTFAAS
jgi:TP901-1 family phage major tail protein